MDLAPRKDSMETLVRGYVAPGFGPVADAFRSNFDERGERGAACTLIMEGVTVVDICGEQASDQIAWTEATRCVAFSVSKGITAICLLMAADKGLLDLDSPVAAYWPEFGVHGKDHVTVRQVLAHRAGLPSPDRKLSMHDLEGWFPVVDALAGQAPLWEPNSAFAYHPVTVGFLAGEVLRRATGLRPAEWLAKHVSTPLGLDTTYGSSPDARGLARVLPYAAFGDGVPLSAEDQALMERSMLMDCAYGPDIFTSANTRDLLGPESPAVNVVSSARDLARLFGATVSHVEGVRLLSAGEVEEATRRLSSGKPFIGPDKGDIWGTGFMLHSRRRLMAGPGSFGHDGAAGQLAFAQPSSGLGFAYQTTLPGGPEDTRAEVLSAAVRRCL